MVPVQSWQQFSDRWAVMLKCNSQSVLSSSQADVSCKEEISFVGVIEIIHISPGKSLR